MTNNDWLKKMDGSDKSLSSSSPIPKPPASDAGETNENNQSNLQVGSKSQNPKKTTTKNFMSPTISAASKTVVPRKKILAERNEAPEDTHLQKTPNIDSKPSVTALGADNSDDSLSHVTPSSSSLVPEFNDDEQNTYVSDSSLRPYDPLTNYLSPRPKFLRYKPNRCHEIFLRRENETREEGKDGLRVSISGSFNSKKAIDEGILVGTSGSSASPSSQEGSVAEEDEEIDEEEDEFEEVEDEGVWNLKGLLSTLLIFAVLFLSTLYISSMNSPTPSPALQPLWGLRDSYVMIQKQLFGAAPVKSFEGERQFLNRTEEPQISLVEEMGGEDMNMEVVDDADKLGEVVELQAGENEVIDMVGVDNKGAVEGLDEEVGGQAVGSETKPEGEVSDQAAQKFESSQDYQIPFMSDWVDHHEMVSDVPIVYEEKVTIDVNSKDEKEVGQNLMEPFEGTVVEGMRKEEEMVEHKEEKVEETATKKAGEVTVSERMDNEDAEFEITNPEIDVSLREEPVERKEIGSIFEAVTEVSISFAIVASLFLGFHFKFKKTFPEESPPDVKPSSMEEKSSSQIPNDGEEHIDTVASFVSPPSLIHSTEEAYKEFYQSRAPTVELLGEFEVGEVSSSLKWCRTSRIMEGEQSSHSVSQEKRLHNKAKSEPIQAQPALSEFSTMGSPTYGSFIEEKIVKKEKQEGRDGGGRKEVTTPVRRSSRIRNRTAMSP